MRETRDDSFWSSWWRVAGLAGLVYGVGLLVAFGWLTFAPGYTSSVADIREFFVDSATLYLTADFVVMLLLVLLLPVFAAGLRGYLGRAEGGYGMWSRLVFGGAILGAATALLGGVFWRALAFGAVEPLSDPTLQAFMHLDAAIFSTAVPLSFGLMLLGASIVIVRTGTLARWLGWLGLATVAVTVVGSGWLIDGNPDGFLAFLPFVGMVAGTIWTALVGGALVMKRHLPPHVPGEGLFAPAEAGSMQAGREK